LKAYVLPAGSTDEVTSEGRLDVLPVGSTAGVTI